MDGRESSREIERAAAAWVARMDRAPLSAGDQERLRRWLAGDAQVAELLRLHEIAWQD